MNFGNLGWGKTNRLAQLFPNKGAGHRTVMLAIDHPYFMGPTSGLEDPRKEIANLARLADAVSPSKGTLEYCLDPKITTPIILRVTGGTSMTKKEELSDEHIITSIEEALRLNCVGVSASVFIDTKHQAQTIKNLGELANKAGKYGLLVLGITAVGAELEGMREDNEKFSKYLAHAGRIIQENGANIVKTYYCESFEKVREGIQTPIVIAGGKKVPEKEALEYTFKAIKAGADGVDMGRNIFQAENPWVMIQAVSKIIHENASLKDAYDFYKKHKPVDVE